jgi:hypothetical protein
MPRVLSRLAPLVLLQPLLGCATEPADEVVDADDSDAKRALFGTIEVEGDPSQGSIRSNVTARFVRVAPGDRTVAARALTSGAPLPELGGCARLVDLEEAAERSPSEHPMLDLLDVGDVQLVVRRDDMATLASLPLALRAFPDVGDRLSGVFYTSPDGDAPLPAPARYAWSTSGAQLLEAFTVVASAPPAPTGFRVDGQLLDDQGPDALDPAAFELARLEPRVEVAADRPVSLSWESLPTEAADVFVDVHGGATWRCHFADSGAASLPPRVLVPDADARLTVSLHRRVERTVALDATDDGRDSDEAGEARVRFDFSRTASLRVR